MIVKYDNDITITINIRFFKFLYRYFVFTIYRHNNIRSIRYNKLKEYY